MSYILLVEDNQSNADMVIRLLQSINYEVRHTLRGLEGAKMARKDRPALILMDFNLPDIDGRTLVLQLKKQLGGDSAPPIVALTARTGDMEISIARKFGCTGFISKPFAPEELLNLVRSLVPIPTQANLAELSNPMSESSDSSPDTKPEISKKSV